MAVSHENIRNMIIKSDVNNDLFIPLMLYVQTPYKVRIPIGFSIITKKSNRDNFGCLKKLYISKIWRASGYEEKCVVEVLKFAFGCIPNC